MKNFSLLLGILLFSFGAQAAPLDLKTRVLEESEVVQNGILTALKKRLGNEHPSFKDAKVGEYYNKNFINVTIDAESREGIKIARRYGISSYPTLIITDYNGKPRTKTTGFKKPYILINFGRRIVP